MLEIDVATAESFDETSSTFTTTESFRVKLEHSLVSVSKWESFWEKPFLGKEDKTQDETISYVRMMILGDELPPEVFAKLLTDHLPKVKSYIEAKMTATIVPERPGASGNRETITAELVYYWMVSMRIPVEFENWHLNRLLMLIRVISFKNEPRKKGKPNLAERRALNRQRLADSNTQR
jgi:hypothetical protein